MPASGVRYRDAEAYAAWLFARTVTTAILGRAGWRGTTARLPTRHNPTRS
ncbi:MAG: hypothetical protein EKK31_34395 [Hyphomicrobiales bacterium]|nr:MAG: hypothetical protein EKK31_34395 [Hyphomicrobiales bacterium]